MTTKAEFAPEEWTALIQAPLNVALLITAASPSLFGGIKEMYAAAQSLVAAGQLATPPNEFMGAIFAEYRDKEAIKASQPKYETKDPYALRQAILESIAAAVAAAAKATPEESTTYREWLYQVGVRQANASKEGGFLGIGAVRVSEAEQNALAELARTLGVEQPGAN